VFNISGLTLSFSPACLLPTVFVVYVSHVQWSDSEEQGLLPAPEQQGQCASGEEVCSGNAVNISITPKNYAEGASILFVEKLEGIR